MVLEDRSLLSTFTVTSTADSGPGSLRAEIGLANAAADAATIDFDPAVFSTPRTITLTGGQLQLKNTQGLTIDGPGDNLLAISGNHRSRVFQIDRLVPASLSGITIRDGTTTRGGGGVINYGTADLTDCTISGNSSQLGGGLYSAPSGSVTLRDCTVSGNTAPSGGGVAIGFFSSLNRGQGELIGCTIANNSSAYRGGGVFNSGVTDLRDCTISGNSLLNPHHAFSDGGGVYNAGTVTLERTTITGNSTLYRGGGLANEGGSATLTDCTISGNTAGPGTAGGVLSMHNDITDVHASLSMSNCVIGDNTASDGGGIVAPDTLVLTDCTISGNTGSQTVGGVIVSGTATLDGCTIENNTGYDAGGLSSSGELTMTDCTVSGNTATWIGGGGLANSGTATVVNTSFRNNYADFVGGAINNGGTLDLIGSVVSGNSSAYYGGGIFNNGTLTLTDTTVSGNSATLSGGGIATFGLAYLTGSTLSDNSAGTDGGGLANGSVAYLADCTISGNSAAGRGGGLANGASDFVGAFDRLTLVGCTVSGNTAATGGGLFNSHYQGPYYDYQVTSNVDDSIVAGNNGGDIGGAPVAPGAFNLIGTGGSGGLVDGVDGNIVGVADPGLAPLGDYGGPTQTMPLLPGSPAIDAGSGDLDVDANGDPLTTDQRGFARSVNGRVDIGAFESSGFILTVVGGDGQSALVNTPFAAPLSVSVTPIHPGDPVAGGNVTFTPPASGASAVLSSGTATIGTDGTASVPATANGEGGSYMVAASASGAEAVGFHLTNQVQPAFSNLSAPTIVYGTASTTISGTLGVPSGSVVTVALNGVSQSVTTGTSGGFAATFNTATLAVAGSPYSVTVSYAGSGDGVYLPASGGTTLTVTQAPTTTAVVSSNPTVAPGQSLTFTATVSGGPATGTVQFQINGQNVGTPVPLEADDTARFTTTAPGSGSYSVTAIYSGDSNFAPSTSPPVTQTVLAPGIYVVGSTLYIVGANTSDYAQITPSGSRNNGSTGLTVAATINGSWISRTFNQPFTSISVYGYGGNDVVSLASALTLSSTIAEGNGNNIIVTGDGNDTVTMGDGNNYVHAGNGNDTVTTGNGNNTIVLGDGDNVVVEGDGNNYVHAGNGANLIVGGLGQHTILLGNGTNILIDGSVTLTQPGDSLRQILADWKASPSTAVNSRVKVTYNNTRPNYLAAGTGRDWFFYTYPKTTSNRKATDRLN